MAEFLTTAGTSHALEQLIKHSKDNLYLISPYIQLNPILKSQLSIVDAQAVDLRIVYREVKNEDDLDFLKKIRGIKLYSLDNLHAKCYMNQDMAIVTSLNLYQYSQHNNVEFGIKINKSTDLELYNELSSEVNRLFDQSKKYDKLSESMLNVIGLTKKAVNVIQDIMAPGYCIRCGKQIDYNPEKPLCDSCYKSWSRYKDPNYEERYCNSCGKKAKTSFAKPKCYSCFKK
jgi:phosphatidylserine/phosphatidylglycerophosphate/cardiolipin synthase-like enzyme